MPRRPLPKDKDQQRAAVLRRFSLNVRQKRLGLGLSQERLAELAGLHRTEVGLLERAEREPMLNVMIRLATVFGISVDALLEGIEVGEDGKLKVAPGTEALAAKVMQEQERRSGRRAG